MIRKIAIWLLGNIVLAIFLLITGSISNAQQAGKVARIGYLGLAIEHENALPLLPRLKA